MRRHFFLPILISFGALFLTLGVSQTQAVTERTMMLPETGDEVPDEDGAILSFQTVEVTGDIVKIAIRIDTSGKMITKVIADFLYPSDLLEVIGISVSDSPVEDYFETDFTTLGIVRFSYDSDLPLQGDGSLGTITFRVLRDGDVTLRFTDDAFTGIRVPLLNMENNVLTEAKSASYTISGGFTELPQTGVELTESELVTGFIILIVIIMIALLVLSTVTIWGGVYLSLGKWQGKLVVGAEKKALLKKMEQKSEKKAAATKKKSKKQEVKKKK